MNQQLLYEGKAKKIFKTETPHEVVLCYKDALTAGDGAKKGSFVGKGEINAQVTAILFNLLNQHQIDTHLIDVLDEDETSLRCAKVEIIPLEIVVRNIAAGSFSRRYGVEEGTDLNKPLVELFVKDDELHDPLITKAAALELGYLSQQDFSYITTVTLQINRILQNTFDKMGLQLVDYKLEFGKDESGKIQLADEITQDTIRIWDKETGEKRDKDRFRRDLGGVKETYERFLDQLTQIKVNPIKLQTVITLHISQKEGIIDAAGDVTLGSLKKLGFDYIKKVEVGKNITLEANQALNHSLLEDLQTMIKKFLSNPLIESTDIHFSSKE